MTPQFLGQGEIVISRLLTFAAPCPILVIVDRGVTAKIYPQRCGSTERADKHKAVCRCTSEALVLWGLSPDVYPQAAFPFLKDGPGKCRKHEPEPDQNIRRRDANGY